MRGTIRVVELRTKIRIDRGRSWVDIWSRYQRARVTTPRLGAGGSAGFELVGAPRLHDVLAIDCGASIVGGTHHAHHFTYRRHPFANLNRAGHAQWTHALLKRRLPQLRSRHLGFD